MSNHQQRYKERPAAFTDSNNGRLIRAGFHEERRRVNRTKNFERQRDIPRIESKTKKSQPESDLERRLRTWKLERDLKKKKELQMKKPVFKVGIVHHNFNSPPISVRPKIEARRKNNGSSVKATHRPSPKKRITRATEKRLEAKKLASTVTPAGTSTFKVSTAGSKKQQNETRKKESLKINSFAPRNYVFTAPCGVTEIPVFGQVAISDRSNIEQLSREQQKFAEEKAWSQNFLNDAKIPQDKQSKLSREISIERLGKESSGLALSTNSSIETVCLRLSSSDESTEEEVVEEQAKTKSTELVVTDDEETINVEKETPPRSGSPVPALFSPFIVASRGKESARKEQQNRMGIRRSSANEIPTKDTVMQSLNISVEDEEKTAQYFKFLLETETERLTDLCSKWETLKEKVNSGDDAEYEINAAIGQTQLLMRKKFERFRGLIKDCETGKGQMLVRCKDLGGFWDLMYREIKDCESRFSRLESLMSNGWKEEETIPKKVAKKKAPATKVKINAKSSARSWILAARKKMSKNEDRENNVVLAVNDPVELTPSKSGSTESSINQERKTITTSSTPKKTPASLRKQVQLSQASKNIRSPLAVIRISRMCKTPEVKLDETISYVNSDRTPAKGILKKTENFSVNENCPPKSSRKVDFNDDVFSEEIPTDEIDEVLQNSIDLGRALARIDSYDSEYCDYDSNDTTSSTSAGRGADKRLDFEDESFDESEDIHSAKLPTVDDAAVPETPTTIQIDENSEQDHQLISERVLRNRVVVTVTPKKSNRRSTRLSVASKV